MIDVANEQLITFAEAARSLPGRPNVCSIWRWRTRGVAGIKLEVICVGGRTYTSREALALFLERVTAAKNGDPTLSRTNRQRECEQRAARQKLVESGLIE